MLDDDAQLSDQLIIGYCDADYAGPYLEGCISTSGYVFLLAGGPISWSSKKQAIISLLSTESEYIAYSHATQEYTWLRLLLTEMGFPLNQPTPVLTDNQLAIAIGKNASFHARTKHINVKYHYVRQEIQSGAIKFNYIEASKQAADGLTKPLAKIAFKRFCTMLGLRNRP